MSDTVVSSTSSDMSEQDWKQKLTPEQYAVLRERGTEAPFTGALYKNDQKGMYRCAACGAELFSSDTKFDSGTGWPSFTDVAKEGNVILQEDFSHGMHRTEAICKNCGGHLGHVFDDGPETMPDGTSTTGKRYCINSCSLDFEGTNGQVLSGAKDGKITKTTESM